MAVWRWIGTALLTLILALGALGHGAAQEKTEVIVWLWDAHTTDLHLSWQERVAKLFAEENPGAQLVFIHGPNSRDRLVTAAAAGVVPDVSLASIAYARSLYDAGILMSLNPFIERSEHLSLENLLPVSTLYNQKDGVYYGIPWSLEAAAVLYNREHMREAGLDDRPEAFMHWSDLVAYAQALARRSSDGAIVRNGYVPGYSIAAFASYVYANGGDFYSDDESSAAFNSPHGVEALSFIVDLKDAHSVTAPNASHQAIANQTASMVYWETSAPNWGIRPSNPDFTEWLGMAPVPQGPRGEHPSGVAWSNMFVIPRGVKNPELSWAFIELYLRPDMQVANFEHYGGTNPSSPRRDFFQSAAVQDALQRYTYMQAIPQIMTLARPWPFIAYSDFSSAMGSALSRAWAGQLPPEHALAEAEAAVNIALRGLR